MKTRAKKISDQKFPKVESEQKPAWTVLVSQKIDRLRVPASTQKQALSPGKILGNKVGLLLSNIPKKRVGELLNDSGISVQLIALHSCASLGEFVRFQEIPAGHTIMQFLSDRIASGDQKFMIEFSKALKMQSERTESACDLYLLMLAHRAEIDRMKSSKEILDFLTKLNPEWIKDAKDFYTLLRDIGLPSGRG